MKWLVLGFFVMSSALAETSKIVPTFLDAVKLYIESNQSVEESLYLRPDIRAALAVLEDKKIDPILLEKHIAFEKRNFQLRADDKYDLWVKKSRMNKSHVAAPEMAVHAVKLNVVQQSEFWFKDDIYAYFFVTDGVIPTGKVTSIYKGLSSGQSFFFNDIDRAIFPLVGVPAKSPENHLIIDYGIIESDGDDVKEMQKLSSIIIDIAIAVYSSYDPQNAQILINLRKEIKALADLLISRNNDDRLVTSTIGYKAEELAVILAHDSYVEVIRKHTSKGVVAPWEYHLTFRLLRK